MLVQTEIERVKFVVRSYIRTRLHKVRPPRAFLQAAIDAVAESRSLCCVQIEKYARYISSAADLHERLSKAELEHAKRWARLPHSLTIGRHLLRSGQIFTAGRVPLQTIGPAEPA